MVMPKTVNGITIQVEWLCRRQSLGRYAEDFQRHNRQNSSQQFEVSSVKWRSRMSRTNRKETAQERERERERKYFATVAYRSTPLSCGYSPTELLMGRKIRATVPAFHELLTLKWPDLIKLQ